MVDVDDDNISTSENTVKHFNMSENAVKENFHQQYGYNPRIESSPVPGTFCKDEFICPTDARVMRWNENRESPTQSAIKLPKIIVVQSITDPS